MGRYIDDDQPLTVTHDVVKDFLLRYGQDRMARWIDDQMDSPRRLSQQLRDAREANAALRERLHKYEKPAAESVPRNYRSGPMSDG